MALEDHFLWLDYTILASLPLICMCFGLFRRGKCLTFESFKENLLNSKRMNWPPVVLSLIICFINGVSSLGAPKEIHSYGLQLIFILAGFTLAAIFIKYVYIPIFYQNNITTIYEYLERRFDNRIKIFALVLFTIQTVLWLPIIIHLTASSITQITGINIHLLSVIFLAIGILYISYGGLDAILWADTIQALITVTILIVMAVKGTIAITMSFPKNGQYNFTSIPNLDLNLNPLTIFNWYPLIMEGWIYYIHLVGVEQSMVQKYICLRQEKDAQRAIWVFIFGTFSTIILMYYCSVLIYVKYYTYNSPLELSPLLGEFPGLYGLFAARMLIGSLSAISTEINAVITVIFQDIYKLIFRRPFSINESTVKGKVIFFFICTICVSFIYILEKSGEISVALAIGAIACAINLGLFICGTIIPWLNSRETLTGGVAATVYLIWMAFDSNLNFSGYFSQNCYNLTNTIPNVNISINCFDKPIYNNLYYWCPTVGASGTVIVGILVYFLFSPTDNKQLDIRLIAPFIRKYLHNGDELDVATFPAPEELNRRCKIYAVVGKSGETDPWLQILP